jgi:hypothetical protein
MKRVHNDQGTATKSNASGSPPPANAPKGRKRKTETADDAFREKPLKKISTPPVFVQPQEPSLTDRYSESTHRLRDIVKQLNDPRNASNMILLRSASDCIKVMAQMTQRINTAPEMNLSQQQIG